MNKSEVKNQSSFEIYIRKGVVLAFYSHEIGHQEEKNKVLDF